MAAEVPGYENGSIGYEDVGILDYYLNPEQIDLLAYPSVPRLAEASVNSGSTLSICGILTGSPCAGGGGRRPDPDTGGGGGSGGGGTGGGGGGSSSDTGGVSPSTLSLTTVEGATLNGTLPKNDPDGLPATGAFAVGTSPSFGVLSVDATTGVYAYIPNAGFNGADGFTVTVTDVAGFASTVTVNVTVTPVDDGGSSGGGGGSGSDTGGVTPSTLNETTAEDTALNGTLPTNDPDGLPATGAFAVGTSPSNGLLSLNGDSGAYTYTPATNFNGADSFSVKVTDVGGYSTTVTVNVTVTPVDDGGPSTAYCVPAAHSGGDATSGSGVTYSYYCPDGAIYLASECTSATCGGYPKASRACAAGQSSQGCAVLSAVSNGIFTCPDALAYKADECVLTGDGTYNCSVP